MESASAQDFSELETRAWGGFLAAHAQLDRSIDAELRANHDISHVEFEVLLRLRLSVHQRLRIQDLAERSILSRSGVSRLVKRLEERGYVKRQAALEDGRGAYATLTPTGAAFFDALREPHIEFVREHFLRRLTETDQRHLARIWRKILDAPG